MGYHTGGLNGAKAPQRRCAVCSRLAILYAVAAAILPLTAWGGATDPTLAIGQVRALPAGGSALVEITGSFGFDDVVQVDYPLSLVIHRGPTFVRYPVGSSPHSGELAALADGLAASEVSALESAGAPAVGAEMLRLEPGRIVVSLPTLLISAGTITAQLYVTVPGEGTFVSNAVTVTLAAGGGV